MATVENVQLSIAASAEKPDHSIISYSYELHPAEQDCSQQREYSVTVSLWGEDVIDDDVLATDVDQHTVRFAKTTPCDPIRVERTFEVETKLLDEDLVGDDEVFLIVEARPESGDGLKADNRVSGKSNTVVGDF